MQIGLLFQIFKFQNPLLGKFSKQVISRESFWSNTFDKFCHIFDQILITSHIIITALLVSTRRPHKKVENSGLEIHKKLLHEK